MSEYESDAESGDDELEECPTCGRDDFQNERGIKLHHAKTHGESLCFEELECEWCGDNYTKREQNADKSRFCSKDCQTSWISENQSGEDSPLHDRVTLTCKQCGDEYEEWPSTADGSSFCSKDCQSDWKSENVDYSGENHPNWKGGKETLICETCDEDFEVKPFRADDARFCSRECSRTGEHVVCAGCGEQFYAQQHTLAYATYCSVACMKNRVVEMCETCGDEFEVIKAREDTATYCSWSCTEAKEVLECETCGDDFEVIESRADDARFCSFECTGEWISETNRGQNNPLWKGGYTIYRGVRTLLPGRWEEARNETRESAGYECELCGTREEMLHRELDVHHIVPVLSGGTNGSWNQMAVCASCHKTAEQFTASLFESPFTDWSDDELPEGRERWTPDATAASSEQVTFAEFAGRAEGKH